ncbi:MAG TPA: preprotein translocase subunit YajC [Trebonia sp.]
MGNIALAASSTASKSSGFNPTTLILILVVVVGFYMLMIRPQRRRQQQVQQQQNSVQPGARVRTTAGMYATVVVVDGDDVVLEVAPGVEVRYMKRSIMDVVSPGEEPEDTEETAEDSYDEHAEDEHAEGEEDERPAEENGHRPSAQASAESGSTAKD